MPAHAVLTLQDKITRAWADYNSDPTDAGGLFACLTGDDDND